MAKNIKNTFGEHIGMSRYEIWHLNNSGLTIEKLNKLSEKDKKYLISISDKNSVWPNVSFEYKNVDKKDADLAIIQDLTIYTIRSSLPSKYISNCGCSNEQFINYLIDIRDKTFDLINDVQSSDVYQSALQLEDDKKFRIIVELYFLELKQLAKNFNNASNKFEQKLAQSLKQHVEKYCQLVKNALVVELKNWKHKCVFDKDIAFSWQSGFDSWQRTEGINIDILSDKPEKSWGTNSFDSLEGLRNFVDEMDKNRAEIKLKDKQERFKPPARPVIAQPKRLNAPEHKIAIEPEEFLKQFNFRGGEFGQWVSQEERKKNLLFAGNALADLAYALNINESDIGGESLNMAFGARGIGGSRAKAHYEPVLNVINLTRNKGMGSLAHEWGHYLDYKILAPLGKNSLTMEWLMNREPFDLLDAARYAENYKEIRNKILSYIPAETEKYTHFAYAIKENNFDDLLKRCADINEYNQLINGHIDEFVAPKNAVEARLIRNRLDELLEQAGKIKIIDTDFYHSALEIDKQCGKKYFATPQELFARAFEKYVFDILQDKGITNNYLVALYEHKEHIHPSEKEMKLFKPYFDDIFTENFEPKIIEHQSFRL